MSRLNRMGFVVLCLFIISFLAVPFAQISNFTMMPGDLGDSRLNNYFLENIYQFIQGNVPSLIHLNFFYPFPYISGFSDNFFGSSPAYLIPRMLTGQPDTALQIWYLIGFLANFISAFFALRKLAAGLLAACLGALIFTFALPVTAQSGHIQLLYRFGVPLSVAMFVIFLEKKSWRHFLYSVFWLVWQFFCTIYIGFFLLLLLAAVAFIYSLYLLKDGPGNVIQQTAAFIEKLWSLPGKVRIVFVSSLLLLTALMALLFTPYLRVKEIYHVTRPVEEIEAMLPRPQSYFLSDQSWLWPKNATIFSKVPKRHEHQMFVGVLPMLLAMAGFFPGRKKGNGQAHFLISGSLIAAVLLTLYIGGFSFWLFLYKLPLASSIRAVSRICLVLLFPVSYLAAIGVDKIIHRFKFGSGFVLAVVLPLTILEYSTAVHPSSPKSDWRNRLDSIEKEIPKNLPEGSILFFAQRNIPFYADDLDAMWAALKHKVPTLNGYSGYDPPGYTVEFGTDCSELPRRVLSYLNFKGHGEDLSLYRSLMQRVVPIGFSGCQQTWYTNLPKLPNSKTVYSTDELKVLSLHYSGRLKLNGQWNVDIRITNDGDLAIPAASPVGKPVRLAWRFADAAGTPLSGWDYRMNLPRDIPPHDSLDVRVPITSKDVDKGKILEFSIVQEHAFWLHDHGWKPLAINWRDP